MACTDEDPHAMLLIMWLRLSAVIIILAIIAVACKMHIGQFLRSASSAPPLPSSFSVYKNDSTGISFQYPSDWKIEEEADNVVVIVPPLIPNRFAGQGGEVAMRYPYGIRVAPLNAYTVFPGEIYCRHIQTDFEGVDNIPFKHFFLTSPNNTISILHHIGRDQTGTVAFLTNGDRAYQVDLGRYAETPATSGEWIAYFHILFSLEYIPIHPTTKAVYTPECDRYNNTRKDQPTPKLPRP